MSNPVFVLAVLALIIWCSELLAKKGWGKNLGTALIVILIAAVLANLNIIPSASNTIPLYSGIFKYLAPLSIFFLLLGVNLKELKKAGLPMLLLFLLGSVATVIGILASSYINNIEEAFGDQYDILAGMFTGTYTGGSINFNGIAIQYNIQEKGLLYAGAVAIDNVVTTFWMLITLLIPAWIKRSKSKNKKEVITKTEKHASKLKTEALTMKSIMVLAFMGLGAMWLSNYLQALTGSMGFEIPSILILTTFALILAQLPVVQDLKGSEILGLYSVYLFLAVIGAYCEISAVSELASLGVSMMLFTFTAVIIHGLIVFGIGSWIFKDIQMVAISSQANVGGGTTALALAESFGRSELLLPAILIGALGNALGTYLGFLVIGIL